MDERVRIVRKVNGLSEIRIYVTDLEDMGRMGFYAELKQRGLTPNDLGEPQEQRSWPAEIRIPIRREQ